MAEYIEREALLKILTFEDGRRIPEVDVDNFPTTVTIRDVKKLIRDIPAADVEPVVHGQWEDKYKSGHKPPRGAVCGRCNCWNERRSVYCPSCGAKMQEDDRTAKRKPHRLNGVENARKV